jgi:ectoine hydroxylase-related dioxygenase (phytanoyl-CoA dioxygenase family)
MTQAEKYPVASELRSEFGQNGHVLMRGLATAGEVKQFRPAIVEATERYMTETRSLAERDTYGKAFLQITNLWQRDERVRQFVFSKKFAQAAADLLGVEKVRLYHDQALFKEPGGGKTPWHQDQYYWPLDTEKTITMWMPLVDIDERMGMLTFASRSHLSGPVGSLAISDESEAVYDAYINRKEFPIAKAISMRAGDATFHAGWTIHSAGANLSDRMREVMTVIYFADGARVSEPVNPNQAADLAAWLDDITPGEIADGILNPIVN